MMRTDELGTYDEYAIPEGLNLPLKIDLENDAIVGDDNSIQARYNFSSETVLAGFARRKAEFLVKLANGEFVISRGNVLRKASEQWQDGQLVVTFVPIGILAGGEFKTIGAEIAKGDLRLSLGKTDKKKYDTLEKRLSRFVEKMKGKYREDGK